MKKYLITALLAVLAFCGMAATVPVHQLFLAGPYSVSNPAFAQVKDVNGKVFDSAKLLSSGLSLSDLALIAGEVYQNGVNRSSQWHAHTLDNGSIQLAADRVKENRIGYALLFLNADAFVEGDIKVTYPSYFEIYVDGQRLANKTTAEKGNGEAKAATARFAFDPRQHQVMVKYFIPASQDSSYSLKLAVTVPDKYADAVTVNQPKRPYTINDVLEGDKVARTTISPSGKFAKVVFSKVDPATGKASYAAKYYRVNGGAEVYVPADGYSASWMPSGSRIWWIDDKNNNALTVFDLESLQQVVVAKNLNEKGRYTWAPNEKFLVYSLDSDDKLAEKGPMVQIVSPEDRQPGWRNRSFLYKLDLESGLSSRLTFGNKSTYLVDFTPDSKQAYVTVSSDIYTERPFSASSLYRIDLGSLAVDTIWKDQKFLGSVALSPDGKQLLVSGGPEAFGKVGQNVKKSPIANSYDAQLFIYTLADGSVKPITKTFDPAIDDAQWAADGQSVVALVSEGDRNQLYQYSLGSGSFVKLPVEVEVVAGIDLAKESGTLAYYGQSSAYPARAFTYDLSTQQAALLADPSQDKMAQLQLGDMQDWRFKAKDGTTIHGRMYLPPSFDPTKKYPLIVNYYGGTTPVERTFEGRYPLHLYATMGYVVYVLQPSGTIGYGQEFSARHVNAWGIKTADEIIEGTQKFIKEHPFVDASKVGCIGASYGGFMTMYLQTKTDLFAAAISHAGISDITSYWGEGYWGYTYSAGASANSYPWNNKNLYVNQSPLFSADKVKTPILFLHGQQDTNVPIGESIQMYTALKLLGKPAEFVTVEGENHTIVGYKARIAWNNTIFAWFAKYLKGDDGWWNQLYPEKNL